MENGSPCCVVVGSVGEIKEGEEEGSVILANNSEETGGDDCNNADDDGSACELGCGGSAANCCIVGRCGIDCCSGDDGDDGTEDPSGECW